MTGRGVLARDRLLRNANPKERLVSSSAWILKVENSMEKPHSKIAGRDFRVGHP